MMHTQLQEAAILRKSQNYQKAVLLYQEVKENEFSVFTEWDGWSFAYCLSKLNRHQEALDVCRELYKRFQGFEILRTLYAKCIYYTQFIKISSSDLATLKKAARAMYDLSPPHNAYSFTPIALFRLIKIMMTQQEISWKEIEDWLLKMDPDLLNDRPFKIRDNKGKEREIASQAEQWYAVMIKVKAGLNEPRQLLEVLNVARKKKIRWHYNNDIWFARKEAFAYKQLGEKKKAEEILRRITLQKQDWFLIFDLAQLTSDDKEALELLCKAALARGKNEMKLKLYETIYSKIKGRADLDKEAALHLCLIAALREENGWEVKPELLNKIEASGLDADEQGSSTKILEKLLPFWEKNSGEKQAKRSQGVIDHIFPNGEAGFIKADGRSFFFSAKNIKGNIKRGQKVSFEWIDSFDKKKNKSSKSAIKILPEPG